jgi:CheY-like chemotaxis protein
MKPVKVLVVDDEADLTLAMKMGLETQGIFDVMTLSDSTKTMDAARQFRPDILLLDIMMPVMDGGTVAASFAEDPELSRIPIIFLSAIVSATDPSSIAKGPSERTYLAKPVELSELVSAIRRKLRL